MIYTADEIRALAANGSLSAFYKSGEWKKLALEIIKENRSECQLCRQEKKLTRATLVHHVKPLREHPELAYSRYYHDDSGDHMQLMPLCHDCHERLHKRGRYAVHGGFTNPERW